MEEQKVLFEKDQVFVEKKNPLFARLYLNQFFSVVELNVRSGDTVVYHSKGLPELVGERFQWADLVKRVLGDRAFAQNQLPENYLSLEQMRAFSQGEREGLPIELRCNSERQGYYWLQFDVEVVEPGKIVLVTASDISQERLMRKIRDLFVFRNFDYLFLLDAKHNSFIRFTGDRDGTPLPPESGDDYTSAMLEYNQRYVVPEDRERVCACMQISHVVKRLENCERYCFTTGGLTPEGKYRKSRIQFLYYDKPAGLILLSRTDVTQIYLEERTKEARFAQAVREAKHDALTDLYNQKATADLVSRSLSKQYHTLAAVLFIDVDNFKMVNDHLGHQNGDQLLIYLANVLRYIAGKDGIAGRVGGDEFLVYLPSFANITAVEKSASQVCEAFQQVRDEHWKSFNISCSVGIALYPRDGTDYDTLVRKADQALYTSKRYGKNRYIFYSQEEESNTL